MALSQASYDKYHKQLRSGGILIYDSVMVEKAADLPSTAFFSNHHSSVVLTEAQSLHSWTMHRYACSQFLRF